MSTALRLILLSALDADARAWGAAVTANGGTYSGATLKAVSNFFRSAKANNYYSKLVRLNLICGSDLTAARTPQIVGGGSATETVTNIVGGDYTETGSSAGIKGNGTNKSFDTGWNPTARSASSSSLGLFVYVKGTGSAGTSDIVLGGQATSSNHCMIGWASTGSVEIGAIATTTASEYAPGGSPAAKEGFLGITTNGSRSQQYYRNGSAVGTAVSASGSLPNANLLGLADNINGTAGAFSARYLRAYAITTGMSATDAANFYADMLAFQTALTRNV